MDDETMYWEETVVKTFFHFTLVTLVRCSMVTRCKSSPPSWWSEHQLHLHITPRRDIANFMAGDAVRIVNFHRTGF